MLDVANPNIQLARSFAIAAHGAQRYGEHPYIVHLDAVAELASAYGEPATIVAYLHDVVEDTQMTILDIEREFGAHVAACVALLTDAPGANRKERKALTYAKLAEVRGSMELALLVKTADRLANVRACVKDGKRSLWELYRSEQEVFKRSVYRKDQCEPLWAELATLMLDQAFESSNG